VEKYNTVSGCIQHLQQVIQVTLKFTAMLSVMLAHASSIQSVMTAPHDGSSLVNLPKHKTTGHTKGNQLLTHIFTSFLQAFTVHCQKI
jgi:hypothetical protein